MSVKISACTITKNEEKNIARSIESYKDYVDEIIIVDTGSTDDTVKIAESLGAKVIHFKWINDFSAAKNCALEAAKGEWILFLDADEWIKDNGAKNLQSVIKKGIEEKFDAISLRMFNLDDSGNVMETNSSLRLFVNKPNIRYTRKIHEHLFDSERQLPLMSLKADEISLNHTGYAESITKTKIKRNKELIEKNYMNGSLGAIDYFYLAREMSMENPEYSKQFLDILLKDKEKIKEASKLDLANNIHELKLKLTKLMEGKYSFEEKLEAIEDAINTFPNDPMYYYYKYDLYVNRGDFSYIDLLNKVVELDKKYEKEVVGNNNTFARHRADLFYELGKITLLKNDTLKAMEYFVLSMQSGGKIPDALKGLLYIINSQNLTEKISFLNSIFDVSKAENLEFLVQSLRLSPYKDVFLYYFVKYYKDFEKVDISFFTSMLFNERYEEAAQKYMNILIDENDHRSEGIVSSAIVAGELKDFYEKNKNYLSAPYRKVLNAYFSECKIDDIEVKDREIAEKIIVEILTFNSENRLEKLKKIFDYDEKILSVIVKNLYANREYKRTIEEINKFIDNDLSDEFAGEVTGILGSCYFALGDFERAYLFLNQTLEIGYLTRDIAIIYKELINKLNFSENSKEMLLKYEYLLQKFIESVKYIKYEKIEDQDNKNSSTTVEVFEKEVENNISLVETAKNSMYEYANKLFNMNNFYLAEEYYKILLRCDFEQGKIYYKLGKIYNKLGAIELSYYCYKKAFTTSIEFPKSILPENHANKYYIYNINKENENDKCPICGTKSELVACYEYLEDENLSKDSVLIVKYRKCEECNHIFADNYSEIINFTKETENIDNYIYNAYDLTEKLESDDKILIVDDGDILNNVISKECDTVKIENSFEKDRELTDLFKELDKYQDRKLVTIIGDIESEFEKYQKYQKYPLWAKVNIVNAYSRNSIIKLLKSHGYDNVKLYNSKFLKGKVIVVADKV